MIKKGNAVQNVQPATAGTGTLNTAVKDVIGSAERDLTGKKLREKWEEVSLFSKVPNTSVLTQIIWIRKKANVVQRVQVEPDRKGWGRLMDLYKEHDENRIKVAKEDIDSLLVFVRRV